MSSTTTTTNKAPECCICLQPAQTRNGVEFLTSPGCCGNWFHQRCLGEFIAQGGKECPLCKTVFNLPPSAAPAAPLPVPVPLPVLFPPYAPVPAPALVPVQVLARPGGPQAPQVQQQQQPSIWRRFNPFGSPSTPSSAAAEGDLSEDRLDVPLQAKDAKREKKSAEKEKSESDSSAPSLSVYVSPEYGVESLAANAGFHVRVSVEYTEPESATESAEEERTPLDVVCVLDNSGSMDSDGKIENLKKAVEFVLSVLNENDRLSIVTFNSRATLLLGLKRTTAAMKTRIQRDIVRSISANGGTDIFDGMRVGEEVLRNRQTRNPTAVMFLLTDGQDRGRRDQKLALARNLRRGEHPTSLFVFGFGADHDSQHMQEIANEGEGSFVYVDTSDAVIDAFGGAIGSQQGAALRNVEVTLSTTLEGGNVVSVQSGSYHNAVENRAREKDTAVVHFADLFVGERRDFVVALSLPAVPAEIAHSLIASAAASFRVRTRDEAQTETTHRTPTAECAIQRVGDVSQPQYAAQRVRDVKVDAEIFRLRCANTISSAMQLADRGDLEHAQRVIAETKEALQKESVSFRQGDPLALSLLRDLDDCAARMRSRAEYTSGGRAQMSEHFDSYTKQRKVFSKSANPSVYQTKRSATSQSSAMASKGGY